MKLDALLTKLAIKEKNLVILDLSFPNMAFPEFKSAHETRYLHFPGRQDSALAMAAGLASLGRRVLFYGSDCENCDLPDSTLNVKVLKYRDDAVWDYFEGSLLEFGPSILHVPQA